MGVTQVGVNASFNLVKKLILLIENTFFIILYTLISTLFFSIFHKETYWLVMNGNNGFVGDLLSQTIFIDILNVYEKLSLPTNGKIYRGSTSYLKSLDNPIKSEASEMIIDLAKTGDKPLYILGIGCPTNIASAMITAPEIINDIVVIWTSAYPSESPQYNGASLNLVQDPISSRLIFDSGVPHVYLLSLIHI